MARPSRSDAPFLPDGTVVREALRVLRHIAQNGREAVGNASRHAGPFRKDVASFALLGVDQLAVVVDDMADRIFHDAGGPIGSVLDRTAPIGRRVRTAYLALRNVQAQLGIREMFISELRLRDAFQDTRAQEPDRLAAQLVAAMRDRSAISDLKMADRALLKADEARLVALFSVLLCAMTDDRSAEADTILHAAATMAIVLRRDIAAAAGDEAALARLLKTYASYV